MPALEDLKFRVVADVEDFEIIPVAVDLEEFGILADIKGADVRAPAGNQFKRRIVRDVDCSERVSSAVDVLHGRVLADIEG